MSNNIDIEYARNVQRDQIQRAFDNKINILIGKWQQMFESDTVVENLNQLPALVDEFLNDIIDETENRFTTIERQTQETGSEIAELERILRKKPSAHTDFYEESKPIYTQMKILCARLEELEKERDDRLVAINQMVLEQKQLCNVLMEPERVLQLEPIPTNEEVSSFKNYLVKLNDLKINRTAAIDILRRKIVSSVDEFQMDFEDELVYGADVPLTAKNIDRLTKILESVEQQKQDMIELNNNMRDKLIVLWDGLEVSDSIRRKFLSLANECNKPNLELISKELARCTALKRQHIQHFVERIRLDIKVYWEKTMMSATECSRFTNYTNDCYTEDLLALHEMELEHLKKFYDDNVEIFTKFTEHKELWKKMIEFEQKQNEPDRFKNRGGQLLKEEKERNTISKLLPKLREKIHRLVEQYERETSRPFLIYGENIIDVIDKDYNEQQEKKEKQMSARKANTNVAGANAMRTPMSVSKFGPQLGTSTIKRVASRTALTNLTSVKKTKLQTPSSVSVTESRRTNRNLLKDLNSPRLLQVPQPTFAKPKALIKPTPIGGIPRIVPKKATPSLAIRRLSYKRKSKQGGKRRSSRNNKPKILVSSDADSINYSSFENYISANSRSSVMVPNGDTQHLASSSRTPQRTPRK